MGLPMPIKAIETALVINDEVAHNATGVDIGEFQEKVVWMQATKTSTPGNLGVQPQISYDNSTWFNVGSATTFSATGNTAVAFTTHAEYFRTQSTSAATTDGTKYWTLTVKLSGKTI